MKNIKTYIEMIISESVKAPRKRTQAQQDALDRKLLDASGRDVPIDVIKGLLANGANPNAVDRQLRNPLWQAAYYGNSHFIPVLIEAGSNPNHRDEFEGIAMDRAVYRRNVDSIKHLIDGGSMVDEGHLRTLIQMANGRYITEDPDDAISVIHIINAGVDPWSVFTPEEFFNFFVKRGVQVFDFLPEGPMKDKIKRVQREEDLFGSDF